MIRLNLCNDEARVKNIVYYLIVHEIFFHKRLEQIVLYLDSYSNHLFSTRSCDH